MEYSVYYAQKMQEGCYLEHTAGDLQNFRYPHLLLFEKDFSFQKERLYWQFVPAENETGISSVLRRIAAEDITVYEFLLPSAREIHFKDMTGEKSTEAEKQQAFEEVCTLYENREKDFPEVQFRKICLGDIPVRRGFEAVAALYENLVKVPVWMVCLKQAGPLPFPYGSMLKGTDLVLTDENAFNFGQDFLHALYHLKEGIPGVCNDNLFVQEWWADVPALYAMQLEKGRMGRRIRKKPSPHPIHFTDYIYLRAFLGQAFVKEGSTTSAHPVFGMIEPAIRLMMYALEQCGRADDFGDRIRILSDAVLADRTEELTSCFDMVFGEGSFTAIYDTYGIYEKYERAKRFADSKQLDKILFETGPLLPYIRKDIDLERLWKDPAYRSNCIDNLLTEGEIR